MAYITGPQLHLALSRLLKIAETEMPEYYEGIAADSASFARQEIRGRLLKRGFVADGLYDLDSWDRAFEFSRDVGLFKAIVLSGAYSGFDPSVLKALNRCEELDSVLVTINDVWIKPTGDYPSLPGVGSQNDSEASIFGPYPLADDLTTDPMRW